MDYQYDVSFTNLLMSDDNVYDEVGDDNPDLLTQIPNENVVAPTLRKAQRTKISLKRKIISLCQDGSTQTKMQ